jgi:hypothetical protein
MQQRLQQMRQYYDACHVKTKNTAPDTHTAWTTALKIF